MERAVGVAILCLSVLEIWNLIESIRRDRFEERVTVVLERIAAEISNIRNRERQNEQRN